MRCRRCSKTVGTVNRCRKCGSQVCAGCMLDGRCIDCAIPLLCRSEDWAGKYVKVTS